MHTAVIRIFGFTKYNAMNIPTAISEPSISEQLVTAVVARPEFLPSIMSHVGINIVVSNPNAILLSATISLRYN